MKKELVPISKFLSLVLRHDPGSIGLALDEQGWALVDDLLRLTSASATPLTKTLIEEVVSTNDKKRFALSEDGTRIRASQGHSVAIDLGLTPQRPPDLLFHGTASRFLESIRREGLHPRSRQFVHLSRDEQTAHAVGSRHGKPVILQLAAGRMFADGLTFFLSANGVWLTKCVPVDYLRFP